MFKYVGIIMVLLQYLLLNMFSSNIDDSEITTFIHYGTTILNIFGVMEILILCIMGFFFVLTSNRTEKENYILNSLDKMLIILSFFIIGGNFIFIFYA